MRLRVSSHAWAYEPRAVRPAPALGTGLADRSGSSPEPSIRSRAYQTMSRLAEDIATPPTCTVHRTTECGPKCRGEVVTLASESKTYTLITYTLIISPQVAIWGATAVVDLARTSPHMP